MSRATTKAATTDRLLDLPEVRLRIVEKGDGAPVILVHGYMVDLDYQWRQSGVFEHLARTNRVIAYDNRGHGKSQKFYDQKDYGLEFANDLFRVMDGLGLDRAHVVGYSMGAMIVARSLIMRRGRFLSATLGGGAGRFRWTNEERARNNAEARAMAERDIKGHILRLWPDNVPQPTPTELLALNDSELAGKDVYALAAVRASMEALTAPLELLASVREPMLGIVGTADPLMIDLERLKARTPSMQLVKLAGASHASAPSMVEFREALGAFLRR